jgi:hypothetical protein
LWKLVERTLDDLVRNADLHLSTRKEYVIGYFCKELEKFPMLKTGE